MVLLRKVIGDALRARRLSQRRTLRDVSTAANVSLGYLSEIERGHKEASSELLGAVCDALGAQLSDMLTDVAAAVALAEQIEGLSSGPDLAPDTGPMPQPTSPQTGGAAEAEPAIEPAVEPAPVAALASRSTEITDGEVTVRVHSVGPLRTTLTAKRLAPSPDQRQSDRVFVG
jgi:transcriptional regulator with XRE-family HTH domain